MQTNETMMELIGVSELQEQLNFWKAQLSAHREQVKAEINERVLKCVDVINADNEERFAGENFFENEI